MTRVQYKEHKDLIEKWAGGADIECWCDIRRVWNKIAHPMWKCGTVYRVAGEFISCSPEDLEVGDEFKYGESATYRVLAKFNLGKEPCLVLCDYSVDFFDEDGNTSNGFHKVSDLMREGIRRKQRGNEN